jgi:hypothetical protein
MSAQIPTGKPKQQQHEVVTQGTIASIELNIGMIGPDNRIILMPPSTITIEHTILSV